MVAVEQTVGQRIKGLRADRGYTAEEWGELLGVTSRSVHNWEHDRCLPHPRHIRALAKLTKTSVQYIKYGVNDEQTQ